MAESLRDLVVSLSLDTTNFTKNIKSINTQIKAVEADFKAMGAGIANYQQTIDGASKKVETLNQVWLKQTQIVEQNQKALAEAQETLARKQAEYDAAIKNTGVKDYAEKVDKCRNALLNAENAVNRAVTSTSNARTALAGTNAQIEEARRELELVKNGWYDSATAIEKSEHSLNILGYDLQKVGADYEAYIANIKDAEKSEDALAAKRDRLASTVDILSKKYEEQNKQLEEYKKQLEAAKAAEDPQKIREAETNIARTEAALAATNATLQKTSAELAQVNKDLDGHVLKWKNAGEAVTTFGDRMEKRGKTMTKVGKTLTTSITTPLVAIGTYSGKAYIEFEDSMAGVRKTVDATEERFIELEDTIREMALVTPTAANEIAFVMETAGQLGVPAASIDVFTKKMVDFGNVSNSLDATTAAETFARFANIRGIDMTTDYIDRLTSTVFKLSNTMATTEEDVSAMSLNLAAAGTQVGMTDAEIVALAASLSSVGVSAAKGGTAFSKVLIKMESAVAEGVGASNKALEDFAKVAGMTQQEFADLWQQDAGMAFMRFIQGAAQLDEEGTSAIVTLNELGLTEVRLRDTLLRTVNAQELFTNAMASANDEWESASYMSEKVEERYASTANQIEMLKNNATDLAISVGEILLPYVNEFLGMARDFITQLKNMSKEELTAKLKMAAFAAAIGPAVMALGKLSQGIGFVSKGIGGFLTNVGKAGGGLKGLGTTLAKSPGLWMALAAAVAYAGYKFLDWVSNAKAAREAMEEFDKTAREWQGNSSSSFENSAGLSAFGIDKSVFDLGGQAGEAEDWLNNLITVWTDGKSETKAIIDEIVQDWKDGEAELRDVADDSDKAELDAIDKEIEKLLYRYQNGSWNEDFEDQLQDLISRRGEIEIKYHLSGDMESGFDDIVTGLEARLRRGDDMGEAFNDAMAAATEGYGSYLDNLDSEYDARYKKLKEMGAAESEFAKLDRWYDEERNKANKEYAETMTEIGDKSAYLFVGQDGKFKQTQDKLEGVTALMRQYAEAEDTATRNARKADLLGALGDLDEQEILDYKVAVDSMIASYEEAGEEVPTYLKEAQKTLETLTGITTGTFDPFGDTELSEKIKEMFGGLDDEANEVYAHFNIDSLEESFNTWASDYEHQIDATVGDITDEDANVNITKVDGLTATVTYIKDGEKVTEDISALEGKTLTITEVTDDGIKTSDIKIKSVDGLTGKVAYLKDDVMVFEDIDGLNNLIGTVDSVVFSDEFVPPEVEVKGKLVPDVDPKQGFTMSNTDLGWEKGIEDWVTNFNLGNFIKGVIEDAWDSNVIDGVFDYGDSIFEKIKNGDFGDVLDTLNADDGKGFMKLAQYIVDGFHLIKYGEMSEEDMTEFVKNVQAIQDLVNLPGFGNPLANAFSQYGLDVEGFELFDLLNDLLSEQFPELELKENNLKVYADGMDEESKQRILSGIKKDVEDAVENADPVEIDAEDIISFGGGRSLGGGSTDGKGGGGSSKSEAQGVVEDVKKDIEDAVEEADPVKLEPGDVIDVGDLKSDFKPEGVNIMDGIIAGVNSRSGALALALIGAVRGAKKAVEKDNGIASPAKGWRDDIGVNLAKGIGEGVMQEAPAQGKVIANAARYLKDSAAGAMGGGHSSIAGNDVTTNNNVSSSVVNHFNINASVRSDNDIRKLASQIARLTARVNGGYGMLNQMKRA